MLFHVTMKLVQHKLIPYNNFQFSIFVQYVDTVSTDMGMVCLDGKVVTAFQVIQTETSHGSCPIRFKRPAKF